MDDGLAIGGAASGIGLDFPYPNFTGPATAMGLYFARAVREIAAAAGGPQAGGDPTRTPYTEEALRRTYLRALHASHYYRNVETLRDWPSYIERTHFLFEQQIDLVNNAAYVVSRPDRGALSRAWELVRVLRRVVPARRLPSVLADARRLGRTVGVGRLFAAALAPANLVRMAANTLLALLPSRRARIGAGPPAGSRLDACRGRRAGCGTVTARRWPMRSCRCTPTTTRPSATSWRPPPVTSARVLRSGTGW